MSKIVELRHFDSHKEIRIVCDASHNGLGAVLEQLGPEGWRPISFASRYLNEAEKKYSTNKLEMWAVVWGAEYFQNYILGQKFLIVTAESQKAINRLEVLSRDESVDDGKTYKRNSTNQIRTRGLSRRLREKRSELVGAITQSEHNCLQSSNFKIQISKSQIGMDRSMRKRQKFLKQHPSLNSSSNEIEE